MGFQFKVNIIPNLKDMIIVLVTLVILYLILKKLLHKPLTDFMTKRSEGIALKLKESEELKLEAEVLRDEYESRIELAKEESRSIIEAARKRGEEVEKNIISEARQEATGIIQKARTDIEREKEQAFEDMRNETSEMAILIASKILEDNMDSQSQKVMIDKFIGEVGNVKWEN